jgi:hypothetical protein
MVAEGAVYTIDPFVRIADEVIDEVMRKQAAKRRPKPAHKRVRAKLLVGRLDFPCIPLIRPTSCNFMIWNRIARIVSISMLVWIIQPTRCNILIHNEIRQYFGLCRLVNRHAATSCHLTRYVAFSGCADCSADTRNANGSIDLWPIQFSDYAADTRKSNAHNDLRRSSILASGGGACARSPEPRCDR